MKNNVIRGKVRGGEFTTEKEYQDLLDLLLEKDNIIGNEQNHLLLQNVSIINMGLEEIHVIINGGSKIPLDAEEVLSLGDITVASIVVVEENASIRFMGIERRE